MNCGGGVSGYIATPDEEVYVREYNTLNISITETEVKEEFNGVVREGEYEEFFQGAMKKFGISSPDELDDEEKKKFFNYVDKNYSAKNEKD